MILDIIIFILNGNQMSSNLVINKELEILIVEDEPIIAMAMEANLNSIGFCVSGIATTPNMAIVHAQNNYPDLALVDINLNNPNQSGIDVAKYIWKNLNIPIIFLTSYNDNKTLDEAMEAEPYAYLVKPCKEADLKAAINTTIHKHKFFFKNKDKLNTTNEKKIIQINENMKYDVSLSELHVHEKLFPLTRNEKKLFEILSKEPGKIVGFDTIFIYIWREDICDLSKLRSLIYRLKVKLGENPFESVYEMGYRIKTI